MRNFWHLVSFITIASSIYLGIHYYLYWRIAHGLNLNNSARLSLRLFLLLAAWTFLFGEFLSRFYHCYFLKHIGSIWFGIVVLAFTIFVFKDILEIIWPEKSRWLTSGALFLTIIAVIIALIGGLKFPRIKDINIPVKDLPRGLNNFSIIQLSDLHLSNSTAKNWLKLLVEKVNATNPDLIVITGDLTDIDLRQYPYYLKILRDLKARYGVYAVSGNHEFYLGIEKFEKIAREGNFTLLRNTYTTIAEKIILAGVDDTMAINFSEAPPDLNRIFADNKKQLPILLLAHQPSVFGQIAQQRTVIQLSGHTHAGQIPPMTWLIHLYTRFTYGLYRTGDSYLYVTSGAGTWGPPMRLFAPSEIPRIRLINSPALSQSTTRRLERKNIPNLGGKNALGKN